MNKKLKLYKITHLDYDDCVYIFSSLNINKYESIIRDNYKEDGGDTPFDIWKKVHLEGIITKITDINQVPKEEILYYPYNSDELSLELVNFDIQTFFNLSEEEEKEILEKSKLECQRYENLAILWED